MSYSDNKNRKLIINVLKIRVLNIVTEFIFSSQFKIDLSINKKKLTKLDKYTFLIMIFF